jgi:hypothetical protein
MYAIRRATKWAVVGLDKLPSVAAFIADVIPTSSAEALLERMLTKVDGLVEQRDRLKAEAKLESTAYASGKRIVGTSAHRRI